MKVLYPLWLWLVTISIAPILNVIYTLYTKHQFETISIFLIYSILCGLYFSIPVFIITYIAFLILRDLDLPHNTIKLSLAIVAIIGIIITFYFISLYLLFSYTIIYSLSVIIASCILRIKNKEIPK